MAVLMDMVRGIRNIRAEYNVDPGRQITAVIAPASYRSEIERYDYLFARLCNVAQTTLLDNTHEAPDESASVVVNEITVYLPLAGLMDVEAECQRLTKEQVKINQQLQRSQNMLNNEQFVSRAKPEVVERERKSLLDLQASLSQIEERIAQLCK